MIPIADLVTFIKGWPDAIKSFQETGKIPSLMEQALWKFGGAQGTQALANYAGGFNTITPTLLASVESGMNAAYSAERPNVISYLKTVTEPIQDKIDTLTEAVTTEFATVGLNISAAVMTARTAVSQDLFKIMQYLANINTAVGGAALPAPVAPGISFHDGRSGRRWIRFHRRKYAESLTPSSSMARSTPPTSPVVEQTVIQLQRRGSVALSR